MRGAAVALLLIIGWLEASSARYLGAQVGALSELHHGVRGRVYAVDSRTLYLHDFHYDGEGPAAYFYVGTSKSPSASGAMRLQDERGGASPLRRYRGEGITLSLPEGKTLRDVAWFSVWCDEYSINFGSVEIPRSLEYPKPLKVGALSGVHQVSSDPIVIVDAQTLLIPNFSYDGEAPDAKFWVGRGDKPSPQGIRIPDENGKEAPLRKYDKKTIVLTLPGELTVFDIGYFAIWCEAFTVNFGHVSLPRSTALNVPPSLKMLGVSPQSKLNCEALDDELAFEVRWAIAGDSIVLQLVARLEEGEYMSFGVSGNLEHSQMVDGDVAVAWIDKDTLKGEVVDYYLDAKSQCAGKHGSCPDENIAKGTNSIRLLNAAKVNGYSIITYQRPLKAADFLDRPIFTNTTQPIIWAVGPLNLDKEVSYHHHFLKGDRFFDFGRPPFWNCPIPEGEDMKSPAKDETPIVEKEKENSSIIKAKPVPRPRPVSGSVAWDIPGIQCYEPPDGVLYAQMGPTGGKQGYPAITGHVGWGISWYINGLLIPEITVVRGKKYTFVVEGGSDPEVPARYHPFYITDDSVGGYFHKSDQEKQSVKIFAGVRRLRNGEMIPTGVGRLCNWTPDNEGPEADEYPSFGAYQRSLTLVCEEGNPGVVTWIPDKNTPDTVYYQCFTHRYLGWKINVVDDCDATEAAESRVVETIALPSDLLGEESIQVQSRVKPDLNFLDQRKKIEKIINTKQNYNDFSSNRGDGLSGEVYPAPGSHLRPTGHEYELPISKVQIKEVIEAVESLEDQMKDEMKRNSTYLPKLQQYQVHEDVKEFVPEQPIREGDEYIFDMGKLPESFLLPPNQKPQTLQNVLRPNSPKPMGNMRPPFRRPVPPEIKIRRPFPMHKGNNPYPLPMPNPHSPHPHGMSKKPNKYHNNRPPPNMNQRPQQSNVTPMKVMPPMHQSKTPYNQGPPKHGQKVPSAPVQPIIVGKPGHSIVLPSQSQTLSLGHTDIIANQVVKSQITLPGTNDAVAQQSVPQIFFSKPGQIILGKPMDHPLPLDQQQLIPSKPQSSHPIRISSTPMPEIIYHSSTSRPIANDNMHIHIQSEIKSSDFMGQSTDSSTFSPAVNTGFKPDSIVIESGFKPIIREPLMAAEDKIAEYDGNNANRREDTDIEEEYEEAPQYINGINHAYPSDKITETFEPMFIPSPPDHLLSSNDRTKEVFPSNHAKEDRPHPVYVKTENELNALFGKKNMERDAPSDMIMESDKVSPQYLPPVTKLSKEHSQKLSSDQTFTTYDGKTISAATLTSVPEVKSNTKIFSSKLPANTELLLKTPQFGPFKGEIPPVVAGHIQTETSNPSRLDTSDKRTTHLKLVNSLHKLDPSIIDDLTGEGSEKKEEKTQPDNQEEEEEDEEEEDEEYEEDGLEDEDSKRRKRDTKTALFEASKNDEGTTEINRKNNDLINHVDFEPVASASKISSSLTYFIVLNVLRRLL